MAPVYADHPFPLIRSPISLMGKEEKKEADIFDDAGSEMAWVHNMMIRGLNSIYLQAEHIKPSDETSFCQYILHWHLLLNLHHTGEEEDFFPHVERLAGVEGLMENNVEQHHAFHDGLEAFIAYIRACSEGREKYDGARMVQHIDSFGPPLMQHLRDEIPSLIGLKKYADKLQSLPGLMQAEAEKNMKQLGLFNGMPWCMTNWDQDYEDGLWKNYPPAPWFIKFFVRNIGYWFYADWWKFSACDRQSRMQPLYALS